MTFTTVPAPWNIICWLLLLLIAALLIGSFVFGHYDPDRAGRMPKIAELPQSALLIILALIVWQTPANQQRFNTLAGLICFGIAFGFVGDLFMANVFNQSQANSLKIGIGVFAVGHILYMLGFAQIAQLFNFLDLGRYALAFIITWVMTIVLWFALIYRPSAGVMQYAALVYALFLASMAGFAMGLAFHQAQLIPLALGGVLFMLSDTLIGMRVFAGRSFRYIGDVIWVTYIVAQILIVTVVPLVEGYAATGS